MVGTTGFEPATSRTPSVRATRLRYVPTDLGSVSLVFEKGQDSEELFAQIQKHLAIHGADRDGPWSLRQRHGLCPRFG